MIETYQAWLTPDNKIDWRGEAPRPFAGRALVSVSFSATADGDGGLPEANAACMRRLREADEARRAGARDLTLAELETNMRAAIRRETGMK
jgi:hypothetical protein